MVADFASGLNDFDLVLFDCDGVVVDSEILSCTCLLENLREHDIDITLSDVFDRFLGRGFEAVVAQYETLRGQPMPTGFGAELDARVHESFAADLRAIPDIEAVLRALNAAFCLASSSHMDRIRLALARTGLAEFFGDRIFTTEMVRRGKPAPDLFLHAAATMAADPLRSLVIEDSVSGVEAGKSAGMTVWGFIGGSHYAGREGRALLTAAGADRVFDRMSDLPLQ